jgi:hypothetical protein
MCMLQGVASLQSRALHTAETSQSSHPMPAPKKNTYKKKLVGGKRAPSAYNIFMKSEMAKIKVATPEIDHK